MARRPKVMAIVPARMTSTRLPGKVMKTILGRPTLELMLERIRRTPGVHDAVVATTDDRNSQPICDLAERLGVPLFRGSESDVLGRTLGAALTHGADVVVDVASDCIMCDPEVIQVCIETYLASAVDYVSNALVRTYPLGLDVQVYATRVLAEVECLTQNPLHREHTSLYIYQHPERYTLKNVEAPAECTAPEISLVLDTPADLQMLTAIYEALYPTNPAFTIRDVLAFLQAHPDIAASTRDIPRLHTVSRYFAQTMARRADQS